MLERNRTQAAFTINCKVVLMFGNLYESAKTGTIYDYLSRYRESRQKSSSILGKNLDKKDKIHLENLN